MSDSSMQTAVWLTDEVASIADSVARLDRAVKAKPGRPEARFECKKAKSLLRQTLAQAVYAEHPTWLYTNQFREYVSRERQAIEQAEQRLNEQKGCAS